VALADAIGVMLEKNLISENPIQQMIASVSVGVYRGVPVLDLDYVEDSSAETDMNVVMTDKGGFIEIQGTGEDGEFSLDDLNAMIELARHGITRLFEVQKATLGQLAP
jgi:ribonuclease PH